MVTTFYTRNIDNGAGRQNITVEDGIIIKQELISHDGYYTGDGNPELIGKPKSALRGMGFRKVRGLQYFNSFINRWHSATPSYDLVEEHEH